MFEATLDPASLLKKILDAMKDIVNDVVLDCSDAGMSVVAMDSSHVALVALLLRPDGFDAFRCDSDTKLGMNVGILWKMLACAGNCDRVIMQSEDDADAMKIKFTSPGNDKIWEFALKLLDMDTERPLQIPEEEYEAVVTMPSTELLRVCRDLSNFGDTVVIEVGDEQVKFSADGEMGNAAVTFQHTGNMSEEEATTIDCKRPVKAIFALRYFSAFTKATPLAGKVAVSLSSELPVQFNYDIAGVGYLRFHLAPRIEDYGTTIRG